VVGTHRDVCLISDRHSDILTVIHQLQQGSRTKAPLWLHIQSRWCMKHMVANFYVDFKNKDLINLFKRLCC
jgi:hypothetical protein